MKAPIDTPIAVPVPVRAAARRTVTRSQTVWLSEPIDLRTAVERVHGGATATPHRSRSRAESLAVLRALREAPSSSG